jgi:predicted nucleic acid-binding protein
VTVLDSSAVVHYLLGGRPGERVRTMVEGRELLSAPDLLVFEVMAVLRRHALRGALSDERGLAAVADLGAIPIELFPSMPLRWRAWELRHNFALGDALFLALAEELGEPLATSDRALAAAAGRHSDVELQVLA